MSLPPGGPMGWTALEAAHAQEPLPHWQDIVRLDDAPEGVRLRHAALLPEPGPDGIPGGARLTRERARHGLAGLFHCAPSTQLDGLLTTRLLDGTDPTAWRRVAERLTGLDPEWDPVSTVEALLTDQRAPMGGVRPVSGR
ncbi:hypothetical protein ABZ318_27615 [Streptomyces sp. NPDC006197]|uniref:hypothetical protein n=1 Tax=Streptomyces sp. NPDC006197 TaxID=3156685 RepID=UPI0033B1F3F5